MGSLVEAIVRLPTPGSDRRTVPFGRLVPRPRGARPAPAERACER